MSDIFGSGQAASGAAQAAAMITVATLEYKTAQSYLSLQKDIWNTQKKWSGQYHDLWYNKYRPVEEAFLDYMWRKQPYKPQYDAAESRAVVSVRREFAQAREQARRCIDPRCLGLRCATERQLSIEEAKAAVAMINRGFRAEEARKDTKDAQWEEGVFGMLQLGRGLTSAALNALNGAAQTAANTRGVNPYAGFAQAAGNIIGNWRQNQADQQTQNQMANSNASRYFNAFGTVGSSGMSSGGSVARSASGITFDYSNTNAKY